MPHPRSTVVPPWHEDAAPFPPRTLAKSAANPCGEPCFQAAEISWLPIDRPPKAPVCASQQPPSLGSIRFPL